MTDFASMDLLTLWAAVVGGLLPLLLALVNRRTWSSGIKQGVMLVGVAIATVGTMVIGGKFLPDDLYSWRDWARVAFVVYLMTVAAYRANWKPSGVTDRLEVAQILPRRALPENPEGGAE